MNRADIACRERDAKSAATACSPRRGPRWRRTIRTSRGARRSSTTWRFAEALSAAPSPSSSTPRRDACRDSTGTGARIVSRARGAVAHSGVRRSAQARARGARRRANDSGGGNAIATTRYAVPPTVRPSILSRLPPERSARPSRRSRHRCRAPDPRPPWTPASAHPDRCRSASLP